MPRFLSLKLIACLCLLLSGTGVMAANTDEIHIIVGGTSKGLSSSSRLDAEIAFNNTISKLVSDKQFKVELRIYESTPELKEAVDNKDVTGIFSSSLEYLEFEASQIPLLAIQQKGAELKQPLLIIVRNEGKPGRLEDFKGKRLVLSEEQDIEQMFLNTQLLRNRQPESEGFFAEKIEPRNPNVALMNVFFKKADLTVVRESEFATAVELNPQLGKKLKILKESPDFISFLVSSTHEYASRTIELVDILLQLNTTVTGRSLLKLANAQTMVAITKEDLKEVKALADEYRHLKGRNR